MPKYVIVTAQGNAIAEGLSLEDAGRAILTVDSDEYRVRPDGADWVLEARNQTANRPWIKTRFGACAATAEEAEEAILRKVAREASMFDRWKAEAVEQGQWDAMKAENVDD